MLPDGKFSIIFPSTGEWRSIMIKTIVGEFGNKDSALLGKRCLFYKKPDGKWQNFAFLASDNKTIHFFVKVRAQWTPAQLESARKTIEAIDRNPEAARKLYARLEGDDAPKKRQRKLRFSKPTESARRMHSPSPHWPK